MFSVMLPRFKLFYNTREIRKYAWEIFGPNSGYSWLVDPSSHWCQNNVKYLISLHFMEILENFHKTWINQWNFPSEEFIKIIWHMNVSDELMFKKWGILGWKWCTADCAQKFWNTFYFPCHKGWYERCKNCCCTECSLSCSEWRWLQDTMLSGNDLTIG